MSAITNYLSNLLVTGADGVSPGIATTEFIGTVVSAGIVLFGFNLAPDRKVALVTLLAVVYVGARSVVKALAASKKP